MTDRCDLCGAPLEHSGGTGYCSERCLAWDFFGVPVLKEEPLLREMRENQTRTTLPEDWERPMPYPGFGQEYQRRIVEALAELKQTCDKLRGANDE